MASGAHAITYACDVDLGILRRNIMRYVRKPASRACFKNSTLSREDITVSKVKVRRANKSCDEQSPPPRRRSKSLPKSLRSLGQIRRLASAMPSGFWQQVEMSKGSARPHLEWFRFQIAKDPNDHLERVRIRSHQRSRTFPATWESNKT